MQDNVTQRDVATKTEWNRPTVEVVDFDDTQNGGVVAPDGSVSTGPIS